MKKIFNQKVGGRSIAGLLVLVLLVVGITGSAQAADFRSGGNVIIAQDEVINDDLFVTGDRVEMDGTVNGDLFASGTEVVVNGKVTGSLVMTGRSLTMNGQVDGSMYSGAYALTLGRGAKIGRNLYFGGFSLETQPTSTVGHSIYGSAYQLILDGQVDNDVQARSSALELNGQVGGNVSGEVSAAGAAPPPFMPNFPWVVPMVAPGLREGQEAKISGAVNVQEIKEPQTQFSLSAYLWNVLHTRLGEWIALLIIGGVLLWLWPGMMQRVSQAIQANILPNAGWGCLLTLLFPLALLIAVILLVMITILGGLVTFGQLTASIIGLGGASLGLAAIAFLFVVFSITKVIIAFWGGRLILSRVTPNIKSGWLMNFICLVLGALIYEILRAIPILGELLALVVILVGLGAIYMVIRGTSRPSAPTITPEEITPPAVEGVTN